MLQNKAMSTLALLTSGLLLLTHISALGWRACSGGALDEYLQEGDRCGGACDPNGFCDSSQGLYCKLDKVYDTEENYKPWMQRTRSSWDYRFGKCRYAGAATTPTYPEKPIPNAGTAPAPAPKPSTPTAPTPNTPPAPVPNNPPAPVQNNPPPPVTNNPPAPVPNNPPAPSTGGNVILKGTAQLTTYTSYPPCCPGGAWYNAGASRTECTDYNGCTWMGQFAWGGSKSYDYVKNNDIVAFFASGSGNFHGGKKIRLTKNGKQTTAMILDTCGDSDCNGCCTKNAKGGYLVDLEYFTAQRLVGDASNAHGTIEFEILA